MFRRLNKFVHQLLCSHVYDRGINLGLRAKDGSYYVRLTCTKCGRRKIV